MIGPGLRCPDLGCDAEFLSDEALRAHLEEHRLRGPRTLVAAVVASGIGAVFWLGLFLLGRWVVGR